MREDLGRRKRLKEIQILRKEIQAGWNNFQIRRNEIQIKCLAFLRRIEPFQGLTLTPRSKFAAVLPPSSPGLSLPPTRFGAAMLVRALL